ncbi:unnamed protein product, partial [Closterium sp. NIES-53]
TSGMGLMLGGRARVVLTGHADASWVDDLATQRSSSCEAEIYAGAMAAQELRWLTYLLTDLGEAPRSPLVLTKHIALRYFLARELQHCGQLRLAYVASQANTADVFTKALQPCDHQRFCTVLACFAFLDWSCDLLFSPILPMGFIHHFVNPSHNPAFQPSPSTSPASSSSAAHSPLTHHLDNLSHTHALPSAPSSLTPLGQDPSLLPSLSLPGSLPPSLAVASSTCIAHIFHAPLFASSHSSPHPPE